MIDLTASAQFMAAHARAIDRRRYDHLFAGGSADAVLRALEAYRNEDGGIGLLEPDLRGPGSQPSCALYALGILQEVGAGQRALALSVMDWLQGVTCDDGGVPFVLPDADGWPHAPWFDPAAPAASSLLITSGLAAQALRLGLDHPWVDRAAAYCWEHLVDLPLDRGYTVRHVIDFLDAVPDRARADLVLEGIARRMPASGVLPVSSGADGEVLRALDVAPRPDHAARRLFPDPLLERELDARVAAQEPDGGWTFNWLAWNPTAAWEWRGVVTVEALTILRAYGRWPEPVDSGPAGVSQA
jgi:hypothetical protein